MAKAKRKAANGAASGSGKRLRTVPPAAETSTQVELPALELVHTGPFRDEDEPESSDDETDRILRETPLGNRMVNELKAAHRAEMPYTDEFETARSMHYELRRGPEVLLTLQAMEFALCAVRSKVHPHIHMVCDAIDEEMQTFASTPFTTRALFSPMHYRKSLEGHGSGAFGNEIDIERHVGILEYIDVRKAENLRKGYGSKALELLMAHHNMRRVNFLFANPRGKASTLHFLRSCGFRRVGTSTWFCFVRDPAHPSRAITAHADHDPGGRLFEQDQKAPEEPFDLNRFRATGVGGPADSSEATARWPLHAAVCTWRSGQPSPIRALSLADRGKLEVYDEAGYTPLHCAIASNKFELAMEILELPLGFHYAAQKTEAGESCMRLARLTEMNDLAFRTAFGLADREGSSAAMARLKARLKGSGIVTSTSDCTCGNCVDGWLSGRMRVRLRSTAAMRYQVARDLASEDFANGVAINRHQFIDSEHWPESMFERPVSEVVWLAYFELLESVAGVLRQNAASLSANAVLAHARAKPGVQISKFFEAGGTMNVVINALLYAALRDDPDVEEDMQAAYAEEGVPPCANDNDFELVREKLTV